VTHWHSDPVPYWRSDRDFYSLRDPRRAAHVAEIDLHERIDNRIAASSADGSYSIVVTRKEMRR
jgi:hypothetical protein